MKPVRFLFEHNRCFTTIRHGTAADGQYIVVNNAVPGIWAKEDTKNQALESVAHQYIRFVQKAVWN